MHLTLHDFRSFLNLADAQGACPVPCAASTTAYELLSRLKHLIYYHSTVPMPLPLMHSLATVMNAICMPRPWIRLTTMPVQASS